MIDLKLPEAITTIDEAKRFLSGLYEKGYSYHPEDDAHNINWHKEAPCEDQCNQLNKLMDDIYNLPGNKDAGTTLVFCPCGYLLDLDKIFTVTDKTGRDVSVKKSLADLKEWDEVSGDCELVEWLENAEEGDVYEGRTRRFEL